MFKYISKKLLALIGMLLPISAFADGPFTPPAGDVSVKILDQLFGGLVNGGNDAFSGAIGTFNGAVLIVGGILATYTLLAGTLGTAHDGEMLGKKFSSVWIPIRYALGTALVLPVIGNGYCIMQQIVMWCIIQGVGLADAVWNSYNPAQVTPPVTLTTAQKAQILTFAENIAMAQICTQANAAVLNEGGTAGGLIDEAVKAVSSEYKFGAATSSDRTTIMLGDQSNPLTATSCGKIFLPQATQTESQNVVGNNYAGGKLGDISSAFKISEPDAVYQIHATQTQALVSKLGTLANAAVVAKTPLKISDVQTAAKEYITNLETNANAYAQSNASPFAQIKANSATQGWILAGAWFTNLATANQKLSDAVGSLPTATYTWQLGSGFKFLSSIQPMIGAARTEVAENLNLPNLDSGNDEKDDSKGKVSQSSGVWAGFIQGFISIFTGLDLENLGKMDKPAILTLQDAGNRMMSAWAWSLTGVAAIATVFSFSLFGTSINVTPLVLTLLGFAFIPISALVALGFTLAYLLPNLPFLMWIGIVLGWIIMCIEAVLAAPLWAVMHLHPNGDDLTGRGGNGYMLLLGLLLRPALTIFGLIAALTLTDLMGEFVNKIFFSVFISGSRWGLITILSIIFAMSVYTSAMVQLFRKTFSLMHVIPDQLMRWIGGGSEQMGQYAGGLAEAGQKGVQSAAAAGSFMGEKSIQTGQQVMGQYLNLKNEKDRKKQANDQANQAFKQAGGLTEGEKADKDFMKSYNEFQNAQKKSATISGINSKDQQDLNSKSTAFSNLTKARADNANNPELKGANANAALKEVMNSGQATINGKLQSWKDMNGANEMEQKANFERAIANSNEVQSGVALDKAIENNNNNSSLQRFNAKSALDSVRDSGVATINGKSMTWQNMNGATDMEKKVNFEKSLPMSNEVQSGISKDKEIDRQENEESQTRAFTRALLDTQGGNNLGKGTYPKSPTNLGSDNNNNMGPFNDNDDDDDDHHDNNFNNNIGNNNPNIINGNNTKINKGNNEIDREKNEQHLIDTQINAMTATDLDGNYLNPAAAAAAAARFSPNRSGITSNAFSSLSSSSSNVNSNSKNQPESYSTNPFSADQSSGGNTSGNSESSFSADQSSVINSQNLDTSGSGFTGNNSNNE